MTANLTTYRRKFTLNIAHFNDEAGYRSWASAEEWLAAGERGAIRGKADLVIDAVLGALRDTHGHTLHVVVEVRGPLVADGLGTSAGAWVVDDVELRNLVAAWDHRNLSVLDDFKGIRATTENIARVLAEKILAKWQHLVRVEVRIGEGDDAEAAHVVGRSGAYL